MTTFPFTQSTCSTLPRIIHLLCVSQSRGASASPGFARNGNEPGINESARPRPALGLGIPDSQISAWIIHKIPAAAGASDGTSSLRLCSGIQIQFLPGWRGQAEPCGIEVPAIPTRRCHSKEDAAAPSHPVFCWRRLPA